MFILNPRSKVVLLYRLSLLLTPTNIKMCVSEDMGLRLVQRQHLEKRLVLDHTHVIVIGQQVEVGNDITIMHGVILGSIGNQLVWERKHPRVQSGSSIRTIQQYWIRQILITVSLLSKCSCDKEGIDIQCFDRYFNTIPIQLNF